MKLKEMPKTKKKILSVFKTYILLDAVCPIQGAWSEHNREIGQDFFDIPYALRECNLIDAPVPRFWS